MEARRDMQVESGKVYEVLEKLKNDDDLKELFSSILNYDLVGEAVATRGWNEELLNNIKEITLLAKAGDFHIIFCKLDNLRYGIERPIINQIMKGHQYFLTVFTDIDQENWHFVNVKYDPEEKNRKVFRRIVIGEGERLHTASQRLANIFVSDERISPLSLQTIHDEAFDVEAITKEFFGRFVEMFHLLEKEIAKNNPSLEEVAGQHAQTLLNRLMFLYFIQKKGWLDGKSDYLYDKFTSYYEDDPNGYKFYSDFLVKVFQAISTEKHSFKELGDLPFLNGGLFDVDPIMSRIPFNIKISNKTFHMIFKDMLEHYNFTVREDTPLNVEVAVDPEMLGKVFENLILQLEKDIDLRKMTGSYYTPRVIVHFMCQQSLKEYLITESGFERNKIEQLFSMNPADELEKSETENLNNVISVPEAQKLRTIIKSAFILDPAVGSGAFLVGMLHEMLSIFRLLDVREYGQEYIRKDNYDYDLKKHIIESCLYGVDIQEQAVRICELRLWLSLVVDYQKTEKKSPPLPNLTYKIRCGDSLIEKIFGYNVQLESRAKRDINVKELIDQIKEEKHCYFTEKSVEGKVRRELNIISKQCDLADILIGIKKKLTCGVQQRISDEELSKEEKKKKEKEESQLKELNDTLKIIADTKEEIETIKSSKKAVTLEDLSRKKQKWGLSFIWRLDFAEVFEENGGFDIVIGNPPYVKEYTKRELFEDVKNSNSIVAKYYEGKMDYWYFFAGLSLDILRNKCIHSFVTTNYWVTAKGAVKIRNKIINETTLLRFVNFNEFKIFEEAGEHNMVYILKKEPNSDYRCWFTTVKDKNMSRDMLGSILETKSTSTYIDTFLAQPQKDLLNEDKKIVFLTEDIYNLCKKIKKRQNYFLQDKDVAQGIVGAPDKYFLVKTIRNFNIEEKKFIKRFYTNTEKWGWGDSNSYLIYLSAKNFNRQKLKDFPNFFEHFSKHKKILTEAKRKYKTPNKPYYYLHRERDEKFFKQGEKIISQIKTINPKFFYTSEEYYGSRALNFIKPNDINLKYLISILNSNLIYFWLYYQGKREGNQLQVDKEPLINLPIIKPESQETQQKFVILVDKILSIYKSNSYPLPTQQAEKVKDLERQIDNLVYEIYELKSEEITLIENSISGIYSKADEEKLSTPEDDDTEVQ